jgi:hypothetical protein
MLLLEEDRFDELELLLLLDDHALVKPVHHGFALHPGYLNKTLYVNLCNLLALLTHHRLLLFIEVHFVMVP